MSLKRLPRLRGTLSFRLTLWYAGTFTLSSLFVFSIFYYHIYSITMERTDQELLEEIQEVSVLMSEGGADHVKLEMDAESESEGGTMFFRLLSIDGQILKMTNMKEFGRLDVPENTLRVLRDQNKPVLATLKIPNHMKKVRTVYGFISPKEVLQIGVSLEDNEKYLEAFRDLLFFLMIPLFILSTLIGWFLARQALLGVEEITLTAIDISSGSMDKRVVVRKSSFEIDRLANTFNSMLDRIQVLMKSMKDMVDNIAHDLRSPLTRIRGIAEMTLLGKKSIEDYENMAASTIEECDNLIETINMMLDLTETEVGAAVFKMEDLDLSNLINHAIELFSTTAEEKSISIETSLPDKLHFRGDKNRMQRLVTNLLENSIKYTEPGGSVTISSSLDNGKINILFEDTGIGISEKDLPKIFDRFYRCDSSRSEAGIGLGLSLAKAISNVFGGTIHVKSALNKGSTFTVILPQ
ncbi:sensor histidine kinase [Thermodesulfobacteriota bacterium]